MRPGPSALFPGGASRVTGPQLALTLAFRFYDLPSGFSQLRFFPLSITPQLKGPQGLRLESLLSAPSCPFPGSFFSPHSPVACGT